MVVPRLNHLPHLPDLVNKGWSLDICEVEIPRDGNEMLLRHVGLEIVGAWIILLVMGDDVVVPKLVRILAHARRHQKTDSKIT